MAETAVLERLYVRNGIEGSNPSPSANFGNSFLKQKWGRAEGATLMYFPHKILILKGFATLRVAQKVRFELQ